MSFVYERPDADLIDGDWTDPYGNQSLFDKVDESSDSPSDYDLEYIISGVDPSNDTALLRLSDQTGSTPASIRYRIKKQGTSGTIDIDVELRQGATVISRWTHLDVSTTYTTYTQPIDPAAFALISDPSDLRIAVNAVERWWLDDAMVDLDFDNDRYYQLQNNFDEILLLHFDGVDAATTTADSSLRHTVTFNGNAQLDTAQSKFGSSSLLLDGTGDSVSLDGSEDFAFGIGDFTVDCWVRPTLGAVSAIIDFGEFNNTNFEVYYLIGGGLFFYAAGADRISGGVSVNGGQWNHIAVARASGQTRLYLNGVQVGAAYADSNNYTNVPSYPVIGDDGLGGFGVTGWIDEVRVIKGRAAFPPGGFSVPTAAYGDKYPVALLLHGDGVDAATIIPDSAGRHQVTANGNAQLDTAQFKFGTASILFDGTGDYLDVAGNLADFVLSTADFTLDLWVRFNSLSGTPTLFDGRSAEPSVNPLLYVSSSKLTYKVNGTDIIVGTTTLSTATWYHVALVRQSGLTGLFLNGVMEAAASDSSVYVGSAARIGADFNGSNGLNGWIEELRFVKGFAAWLPIPQQLLMHMDGADASTTFTDATGRHSTTAIGNAQLDTAQFKFGTASVLFDGTGDGLNVADTGDFDFGTGNFTMDLWIRLNSTATDQSIFDFNTSDPRIIVSFQTSTKEIQVAFQTVWSFGSGSNTIANTGQWYHIALTRSGSTFYLFVDGVLKNTNSPASSDIQCGANLKVGIHLNDSSNPFNGWMDEIRIVKGVAMWTGLFYVPTSPYGLVTGFSVPTVAYAMNWTRDKYASLLCHFNGPDTSTSMNDATGKHQLTANGSAQIDTAQSKFGGASAFFEGTTSNLSTTDALTEFAFGSGDFTIDFWLRPNAATHSGRCYAGGFLTDADKPIIDIISGQMYWRFNSGTQIIGTTVLAAATWYHIAVARSGNATKLFVNGVQEGSTYTGTESLDNDSSNNCPRIGSNVTGGSNFLNGWIDELRVIKGYAAWTGDFTPPVAPYRAGEPQVNRFISLTRASVAYETNAAKQLTLAKTSEIRISDLGMQVEDARTNTKTRSQEFDNSSEWNTIQNITVTADAAVAPDATTTADKLIPNTTNAFDHTIGNVCNSTGIGLVTWSCYFKPAGYNYASIIGQDQTADTRLFVMFDLVGGTIAQTITNMGSGAAPTQVSSSIEVLGNGWVRGSVTFSVVNNNLTMNVAVHNATPRASYAGDGTSGVYAWGAQCELGAFASSYIPTTSASATRATDSILLIKDALAAFKSVNGSLISKVAVTVSTTVIPAIIGGDDFLIINTDNKVHLISNSDNPGNGTSLRPNDDNVGYSWDSANFSIILNGGTVKTGTDNLRHVAPQYLGGNSAGAYSQLWGYMSRATFWNYKLSDATLQALTV